MRGDGGQRRCLGANMNDNYYSSHKHRQWRERVLKRAGYLCEECLRYGKQVPATVAHHIKHADEHPELRYVLSNGKALCSACHNKEHPEKGGKIPPPSV